MLIEICPGHDHFRDDINDCCARIFVAGEFHGPPKTILTGSTSRNETFFYVADNLVTNSLISQCALIRFPIYCISIYLASTETFEEAEQIKLSTATTCICSCLDIQY